MSFQTAIAGDAAGEELEERSSPALGEEWLVVATRIPPGQRAEIEFFFTKKLSNLMNKFAFATSQILPTDQWQRRTAMEPTGT